MKLNKITGKQLLILMTAGMFSITACIEVTSSTEGAVEEGVEDATDVANAAGEASDATGTAATGTLVFDQGSWAWTVEDFLTNGSGTKTFNLDQIPSSKDEEISAEGNAQLDNLAAILKAHTDLTAEIQAHTKESKNAVGAKAKKTASAARALWVKAKLTARGVNKDQLTSKGYGDEKLLEGIAGDDDSNKRVSIAFTK